MSSTNDDFSAEDEAAANICEASWSVDYHTQLEAAANALEFPWTVAHPIETSNPDMCSSEAEAAIQMKTEVDDDVCEIVCEMPSPSKASRLTSERWIEAGGAVKSESGSVSRICDGSWTSQHPPVSNSSQDRSINSVKMGCRNSSTATIQISQKVSPSQSGSYSANPDSQCLRPNIEIKEQCSDAANFSEVTILPTVSTSSQHQQHKVNRSGMFRCKLCVKTFASAIRVRRHERLHSNERPFYCNQCHKNFRRAWDLKVHEQAVHAGERPYVCRHCNRSFSYRTCLNRHERIHGKPRPTPSNLLT